MARILLIAYYYPPLAGPGSLRPARMVDCLRDCGHTVFTLTQKGRSEQTAEETVLRIRDISHNCDRRGWHWIQWLALRLTIEARNRAGIYASIYSPWKRAVLRQEQAIMSAVCPQMIVATYPPVETLEIGLRLSRKYKLPLIADFRDGLLFEPVERRALKRLAVRRSYEKLETRVARDATAIVTVSPAISRYFQQKHGCRRVATIPNGYDVGAPVFPLVPNPFTPGRFHVVHTGGIALSDRGCDLAPFVIGAEKALAADPTLRTRLLLHFAGRLSAREKRLLRTLVSAGVVRLYGQLPRENAMWMQQNADILLLLASPDRTSVATGKLFEYMQARKPVLALAAGTYAADIIAETGIGWTISVNDPQATSAALTAIMGKELAPPEIKEWAIARYDRKRQCQELLPLLEQIVR